MQTYPTRQKARKVLLLIWRNIHHPLEQAAVYLGVGEGGSCWSIGHQRRYRSFGNGVCDS